MYIYPNLLNVLGLSLDFIGALLILVHSCKTIGAITPADQAYIASPWWFRVGVILLALGFLGQIIGNVLL